jgi:hypothetical protein
MGKIRYLLPTIVLVLSACGGESDTSGPADDDLGSGNPESPAVASIVVEGPVVMLWDAGVSTRLTASALGSLGQVIPGVTFEWISVDPSVAVVEGGVVTTVGDGWTEALASAQGESGGVSIVVVTPDGPRDRTDCIACHADSYTGRHHRVSRGLLYRPARRYEHSRDLPAVSYRTHVDRRRFRSPVSSQRLRAARGPLAHELCGVSRGRRIPEVSGRGGRPVHRVSPG